MRDTARYLARSALAAQLAGLAVLLSCAPGSVQAAGDTFGDIVVNVRSEPKGQGWHGYAEYLVEVKNRSTERTHRVKLTVPHLSYTSGGNLIRAINREVEVGPGALELVSLWQPPRPPVQGSGLGVSIDGQEQERSIPLNVASSAHSSVSWHSPPALRVLAGPGMGGGTGSGPLVLISLGAKKVFDLPKVALGPEGHAAVLVLDIQAIQADDPTTEWSNKSWLGYGRYDGIVLTREEMEALQRGSAAAQAVRTLLFQYVEAGGVLVILGQDQGALSLPSTWTQQRTDREDATIYHPGFGICIQTRARETSRWDQGLWDFLQAAWHETGQPFRGSSSLSDANQNFPVVDDLGIPVRGLFVLMLLFALGIGPLNIWLLSLWKRRIWLLWTVPLISLATCVTVFGYMIVAEGWQGRARLAGFTFLDEKEQRATTLGRVAYYSPLTPRSGLHFGLSSELTVLGMNSDRGASQEYEVDWTRDQHLSVGWVSARIPAHFQIRKSESRRERLTFDKETSTVTNGLGVDIEKLWLADNKGQLYSAERVAAGQQVKLEPTNLVVTGPAPKASWRKLYTGTEWSRLPASTSKTYQNLLIPGSYYAVLESSPFLEPGLEGATRRPSPSVVLGLMASD